MNRHYYEVAGLRFSFDLPEDFDLQRKMPSFSDFSCAEGECDFEMEWDPMLQLPSDAKEMVRETNDMGCTVISFAKGISYLQFHFDGCEALLALPQDYLHGRFRIDFAHRSAGLLISSMLRCFFAQNILLHDGLSLHASCVLRDGLGYLFMGRSGTGKSTHSRLWINCFPGSELLNDDNPAIRIVDGLPIVYGTPWSGKTPCWRNLSAPLRALVRLSQAPENRFRLCTGVEAFTAVYPGCSVLRFDSRLHDALCDTLSELIPLVRCGRLDCLPDEAAALCCSKGLDYYEKIQSYICK